MGTTKALQHIDHIVATMGRFGEVLSDSGPSYRDLWDQGIRERGMDPIKGAAYHPSSQGQAERAVGRLKERLNKVGFKRGHKF